MIGTPNVLTYIRVNYIDRYQVFVANICYELTKPVRQLPAKPVHQTFIITIPKTG